MNALRRMVRGGYRVQPWYLELVSELADSEDSGAAQEVRELIAELRERLR